MDTSGLTNPYQHHRFPAEIISHGVWLYFRFCLSYRDVEELLFARGVLVTYEAIRKWCRKFGQHYANQFRHRRPKPGDKWHLDEVFLTIKGERHYLWRAVDQDGHVLDILVQSHRNKKAAKKFFRKLLKGLRLEARFRAFVFDVYHARPHSETKIPPQQRWEAGGFLPQMPDSLEQLDVLLLTVAKPRKVRRDGLWFLGMRYMDPTLAAYVGESVILRYDASRSARNGEAPGHWTCRRRFSSQRQDDLLAQRSRS